MKLKDILLSIWEIHVKNGNISEPYICGGIPRDKCIADFKFSYKDLDIMTGDASVRFLADNFAAAMSDRFTVKTIIGDDGHVSVRLGNFKVDFSTNFVVPQIEEKLSKLGIQNPAPLQKEMFSRDFTCNALLLPLNLKTVLDPTGHGLKDIKNKIIRPCLDSHTTFTYSVNRIARMFYLAAKTGFDVDPNIIEWVSNNTEYVKKIKRNYWDTKIGTALEMDRLRVLDLLNKCKLSNYLDGRL